MLLLAPAAAALAIITTCELGRAAAANFATEAGRSRAYTASAGTRTHTHTGIRKRGSDHRAGTTRMPAYRAADAVQPLVIGQSYSRSIHT